MDIRVLIRNASLSRVNSKKFAKARHLQLSCLLTAAVVFVHLAPSGVLARESSGYVPGQVVPAKANELPRELEGIKIEPKLGEHIDSGLTFKNEDGQLVRLGDFFKRGKPVILSLVYYSCPSLCNLHLNGVADVFKEMTWTPGQEFEAIAVSFDPKETALLAKEKKANYLKLVGRGNIASGWHFLTTVGDSAAQLARQVGFNYRWEESSQQWAHGSAAIIISPTGEISRYLNGVVFEPQTVKMALVDAGHGKVGTVVDQMMMYCFKFDQTQNKYVFYAFNIMRFGAGLVAIVLFAFLINFWVSNRRRLREGYRGT